MQPLLILLIRLIRSKRLEDSHCFINVLFKPRAEVKAAQERGPSTVGLDDFPFSGGQRGLCEKTQGLVCMFCVITAYEGLSGFVRRQSELWPGISFQLSSW
jgi:hypothetical protein